MNKTYLSYGSHYIDTKDLNFVSKSLKNKKITTGPLVKIFEKKISKYLGVKYVSTCSSGTAALHLAFNAIKLKKDDIILMPAVTFIASYSMAKFFGAKIYLLDVDPNTGQITPETIIKCIKNNKLKKIKCLVSMYLGGYPNNIIEFYKIKQKYGFKIIEDACHAFGSEYKSKNKFLKIGSCNHADISCFSFHPLKTITTGEGGAVTTNNKSFYDSILKFRSHGFYKKNHWDYNLNKLGFNYRLSDINCALGISQLNKIDNFLKKRKQIYNFYKNELTRNKEITFIRFNGLCSIS